MFLVDSFGNQKHAIGVAVEGHPEVGPRATHGRRHIRQVLDLERVGRMIREGAIGLEVEPLDAQRQALEQGLEPASVEEVFEAVLRFSRRVQESTTRRKPGAPGDQAR